MKLVLLLVVCASALAAVTLAAAKEDARSRLTTTLPLDAAPGARIRIAWAVDAADGRGGRQPFGASGMFVRLLSRTGARSTLGFARPPSRLDGRFSATVTVPAGRIGGIRLGLRGTSCGVSGCRRSDLVFPLANDPFRSPGGARCDVAALRATLAAFVRAYNRGDLPQLDRLFARERFRWYSSHSPGVRLLGNATNRGTLISYFRERHRRGDRLRLLGYRFNGYERGRDVGHFALSAQRRANDFRAGRSFRIPATGALDCSGPRVTIAVLSLRGPGR